MNKQVTILTGDPTIALIAEQSINWGGVRDMAKWVKTHRPECLPDDYDPSDADVAERGGIFTLPGEEAERVLFPHDTGEASDNELLVELAGRTCYDSFGLKAGKKTNAEYIANTQAGDVPHASILYHAKMTFFIAGISRRVSHELIRNYVGADRDEEGSPSQESTRFTHHYGYYVAPPRVLEKLPTSDLPELALNEFRDAMQVNYDRYIAYISAEFAAHTHVHQEIPKGMDRKRIYEAASAYLSHACETSFIWTTNPMALRKLFRERCDKAADLEFQRFANAWKKLCLARWPNLFPGLT